MSLEHILLGMLRQPATGYDLKAEFEGGARHFWSAELGQIYPTLQLLERRGLLKSVREKSEKGPPRKVYRRTVKGDRELHKWLAGEPIMGVERFAYIAQLIFLGELHDLDQTLEFLRQLRAKQSFVQDLLRAGLEELTRCHPQGESTMDDVEFHEWLAIRLGSQAIGARVAWCDEVLEVVRQRRSRQARLRVSKGRVR